MNNIKLTIGKKATESPDFLDRIKPLPNCEDRKTMTDKDLADFAENLKINGIIQPLRLWDRGRKGIFCISGNQQIKALKILLLQGAQIPKIAIEWLDIQSEEQAYQLYYAYDSTYGRYNPDYKQIDLPVTTEYLEIMRLSQPMKPVKRSVDRKPKEYQFKLGDTLQLGEVEIILAGLDFSRKSQVYIDSLPAAEKLLKKYVDDCKFKNISPKIKINNQTMKIEG